MSHLSLVSTLDDFDRASRSHRCVDPQCEDFRQAAIDLRQSLNQLAGVARSARRFDAVVDNADNPRDPR